MTQTYVAWDDNEYPWPPPDGWYQSADNKWWPEGYGPGPAIDPGPAPVDAAGMAPPSAAPPAAAPPVAAPPPATVPVTSADTFPPPNAPVGGPPPGGAAPGSAPFGAAPVGGAPPVGQPPTAAPGVAGSPPSSSDSGSGSKVLLILGGLLALLLVAGGGIFALTRGGDDPDPVVVTDTTVGGGDTSAPTTATTTAATSGDTETTAAPSGSGQGTFENPHAFGDTVTIFYEDFDGVEKKWLVEILEPARDGTGEVMDENQFNDPPEDGQVFAITRLRITYEEGPAPGSVSELNLKAVGPSNVALTWFGNYCGVVPDSLETSAELFPGGSVEGNLCFATDAADIGDMVMLIDTFVADGKVYISLQ